MSRSTATTAPCSTEAAGRGCWQCGPAGSCVGSGGFAVPGVLDAEHRFLLQPDKTGLRLMQGERLHGLAVWVLDIDGLRQRFAAMDAALRVRAERRP